MQPIYIPHLTQAPDRKATLQFDEFLPDLKTLTPIKGKVEVRHQGNYLEVQGQAETITTLTCSRCLQHYNHKLVVDTSELIWLDENAGLEEQTLLEREVPLEDLVESLPPQGHFDAKEWLYQQLCLAIPLRQLCDAKCPGIPVEETPPKPTTVDQRWASLEALKRQLPS